MDKLQSSAGVFLASGVVGIFNELLGTGKISFIALLILVLIDTATGMAKAIKYKRFSSHGMARFAKKVVLYSTSIITVRLLEIGLANIFVTTLISQTISMFLVFNECVSILENLTLLGVPIPTNFLKILLKKINIPGLGGFDDFNNKCDEIEEIDEILKYHLPRFQDENLKKLLQIKFKVWRQLAGEINSLNVNNEFRNEDLLYYKLISLVEFSLREIEHQWGEANIPKVLIESFKKGHQLKVNKWLSNLKTISYDENLKAESKKQKLIESVIVILYQTILDALKL